MAYFVGDEEYLIISFSEFSSDINLIYIQNVTEIIPMTKASKSSLEMKFDNRLKFSEPRFEDTFHKFEENIDVEERFNGARAFCILSKVNYPFIKLVDDDVITKSYHLRINDGNLPIEKTYYTQLLIYERYEFFPNTDLGYFYDAGESYAHFKGLPTFVGSNFYNFLQSNKENYANKSFIDLVDIISNAEEIKKFTEQLTFNNIREFIVAALFQKFKSDLRERETIFGSETGLTIGFLKKDKKYLNELNIAIYLTGAFFGYKKFYDDLYSKINLHIFKKENAIINNSKTIIETPPILSVNTEIDSKEVVIISQTTIINEVRVDNDINEKILDELLTIIKNSQSGEIKLTGDLLKEIQTIFKPIFKSKKPTIKHIIDFIKSDFANELETTKKDTISIKIKTELF